MDKLDYESLSEGVKKAESLEELRRWLWELFGDSVSGRDKLRRAIKNVGYMAVNKWPDRKVEIARALLELVDSSTVSQLAVETGSRAGLLRGIASFREQLVARSIKRSLPESRETCFEWALDDKYRSYTFIDSLGVKRPRVYSYGSPVSALNIPSACVVKPTGGAGANGVYLVFSHKHILRVKSSEVLSSVRELKRAMENDLSGKKVGEDRWIVEQLIGEADDPSVDMKFFSFYGEIELVWAISRYPEIRSRWTDVYGRSVESGVGLYPKPLSGYAPTEKQLAIARMVSSEIPAPFIRIDFISWRDELYFGEFTPRPGSYADFTAEVDNQLGLAFLKAEARLVEDMFSGREFKAFKEYLS